MRRRIAIALLTAGAAWLAAGCSGGDEPVVVAGPGPTPDEPPGWVGDVPGNPFPPSPPSNGGECLHCQDVLSGATSGSLCLGVESALQKLAQCACGTCATDCASTCNSGNIDSSCANCLAQFCSNEYTNCLDT